MRKNATVAGSQASDAAARSSHTHPGIYSLLFTKTQRRQTAALCVSNALNLINVLGSLQQSVNFSISTRNLKKNVNGHGERKRVQKKQRQQQQKSTFDHRAARHGHAKMQPRSCPQLPPNFGRTSVRPGRAPQQSRGFLYSGGFEGQCSAICAYGFLNAKGSRMTW